MRISLLAAVATCLLAAASPALAQDYTDEDVTNAIAFAMHDASFTMYHEIGHMLVSELGLPVLGKEEDAVDALAVVLLLNDESDPDSYNALVDAADGWYFNAVKSTGSGVEDFSYFHEHSLDIQRAYAMVCMMVGHDPEVFSQTADAYELDEDARESCGYTYQQAYSSWQMLLEPHKISDEAGGSIEIIYDEPGDYEMYAEMLQNSGILEHAAELITTSYVLPQDVIFRATQCGSANAYYSPSEVEVTYCYELAENMFELYLTDVVGDGAE